MNSRIQKPDTTVSCRIRVLDVYRVGRDGKERHAYKLFLLACAVQVPHDSLSLESSDAAPVWQRRFLGCAFDVRMESGSKYLP